MNPLSIKALALAFMFGALLPAAASGPAPAGATPASALEVRGYVAPDKARPALQPLRPGRIELEAQVGRDGMQTWIVQLEQAPLASFDGGAPPGASTRMAPTRAAARPDGRLDPRAPASLAYLDFLAERQRQTLGEINKNLARTPEVRFRYRAAYNGFVLRLTPAEAARVAKMSGVASVHPQFYRFVDTDRGPVFIGADRVWNGSFAGAASSLGAGVVIGVLDSGLNLKPGPDFPDGHPSFTAMGDDGVQIVNPLGSGTFLGRCNAADDDFDPDLACNDKVIGAYSFTSDDTPDDENGHGSHVAGTAAGNFVDGIAFPDGTATVDVSGVAPHANLIIYDVCEQRSCPGTAMLAALDQVVEDAVVDVVNFSIGGPSTDPWTDPLSQAFLNVRAAGIFVATSAGNSGPGPATVGSPADAPWLTTVANQTHDRVLADTAVTVTGPATVPAGLQNIPAIEGTGPALTGSLGGEIDFDAGNPTGCTAFANNLFDGRIALLERGGCDFSVKVDNAETAGAAAAVIYNNLPDDGPFVMGGLGGSAIPSAMVGNADGTAIRDWIAGNTNASAELDPDFTDAVGSPQAGDIMAGSSSRGPNPATGDLLKPDLSAPGTNIFAALGLQGSLGDTWGFLSGTSMASPHVAGAAALVRDLHPGWTAAEIHSALVMRAENAGTIVKEDAATASDPFDRGGGRVSPPGAAGALLVLDETAADFAAADPDAGGDPTQLNLPTLGAANCFPDCTWTRTFKMVEDGLLPDGTPLSSTWSIDFDGPDAASLTATPENFTLGAGETQTVVFEADVGATPADAWVFGFANLNLEEFTVDPGTGSEVRPGPGRYQRLPIAAFNAGGDLPDPAAIESRRDAGSRVFTGLATPAITELQVESTGLVQAEQSAISLDQDPTRGDPFDDPDQVFARTVSVPPGATSLIAITESAESPDVDLYVVAIESGEVVCASTGLDADERCDIQAPTPGDYRVVVQNWQGSPAQPDAITLFDVVVPEATASNATLSGQGPDGAVAAADPWDLRILFDVDSQNQPGRWFGALLLGSAAGESGDLGAVPVELTRRADDVVKLADRTSAEIGETIDYTLFVDTNLTDDTAVYDIVDTLPAGLALVPDSLQASRGTTALNGDRIEWNFSLDVPAYTYAVTTRAQNAACNTSLAGVGDGGYVNLADLGFDPIDLGPAPDQPIDGADISLTIEDPPLDLYGVAQTALGLSDDGILIGTPSMHSGGSPGAPQTVPDAAEPNNLIAALWQDMEIINDPAGGKGLTAVEAVDGASVIIEYDDLQPVGGDGSVTWDFQAMLRFAADDTPDAFEVVLAYANLAPLDAPVTVGMENASGTTATALVNNQVPGAAVDDSTVVCFDRMLDADASTAQLTYRAEVVAAPASLDGLFTNRADHATDEIGGRTATATARVEFLDADEIFKDGFETIE